MNSRHSAKLVLELRAARIPALGMLALHHWFVLERPGTRQRWEVWQRSSAGGQSWGHLHKDLLPAEQGVGNGPSWVVRRWCADDAVALIHRVETSPQTYPWCKHYRVWPGPNSNTYVQWILGQEFRLGWKAWGRQFARRYG